VPNGADDRCEGIPKQEFAPPMPLSVKAVHSLPQGEFLAGFPFPSFSPANKPSAVNQIAAPCAKCASVCTNPFSIFAS